MLRLLSCQWLAIVLYCSTCVYAGFSFTLTDPAYTNIPYEIHWSRSSDDPSHFLLQTFIISGNSQPVTTKELNVDPGTLSGVVTFTDTVPHRQAIKALDPSSNDKLGESVQYSVKQGTAVPEVEHEPTPTPDAATQEKNDDPPKTTNPPPTVTLIKTSGSTPSPTPSGANGRNSASQSTSTRLSSGVSNNISASIDFQSGSLTIVTHTFSTTSITSFPSDSPPVGANVTDHRPSIPIIVGSTIGGIFLLLVILILWWCLWRRQRRARWRVLDNIKGEGFPTQAVASKPLPSARTPSLWTRVQSRRTERTVEPFTAPARAPPEDIDVTSDPHAQDQLWQLNAARKDLGIPEARSSPPSPTSSPRTSTIISPQTALSIPSFSNPTPFPDSISAVTSSQSSTSRSGGRSSALQSRLAALEHALESSTLHTAEEIARLKAENESLRARAAQSGELYEANAELLATLHELQAGESDYLLRLTGGGQPPPYLAGSNPPSELPIPPAGQ